MKSIATAGRLLNERQKALIDMLADGASIEEAAERLGVRRKYVREALADRLVRAELAAARDAKRAAAQPEAVDRLITTMRQPGEGTAADRRLQLDAAKAILGEDAKAPIVNVGVAINNQVETTFRPGYVIRVPGQAQHGALTIDHDQTDTK